MFVFNLEERITLRLAQDRVCWRVFENCGTRELNHSPFYLIHLILEGSLLLLGILLNSKLMNFQVIIIQSHKRLIESVHIHT